MKVNDAAWEKLRKQIEYLHRRQIHLYQTYRLTTKLKAKNKNYLRLNLTIDKWDKITE